MLSGLVTLERQDPAAEVLIVTNGWPLPDMPMYGVFTKRQVESIVALGVRCDVLFIRGYLSPIAYAVAAVRLAALNFRRPRYRLVHAHGGESALSAGSYRLAPLLVSYCGDDLLGTSRADGSYSVKSRLRRTLLRQHARFVRATITKSHQMEVTLPSTVRGRNRVIPNGVNPALFRPIGRDSARQMLGWDRDGRVALFLGDPTIPGKRYWLAEVACARAARTFADIRLHAATNIEPDDVPVYLSAADCLILTSSTEGSPNAVKEALMCDLPVVTTRVGDVDELLAGVEPSYICDTEEELSEALVNCLSDPRRSNGRTASSRLALDQVAERVVAVYRTLAPIAISRATVPREPVAAGDPARQ
jgi:glycosyltransferase involved in cell wall biosynthesis